MNDLKTNSSKMFVAQILLPVFNYNIHDINVNYYIMNLTCKHYTFSL